MNGNFLSLVYSVTEDDGDLPIYEGQIDVRLKMSKITLDDFNSYTPPDMDNGTAKEFGEMLLKEITRILKEKSV